MKNIHSGWTVLDVAIKAHHTPATAKNIQRFLVACARRMEHHHPQAKATFDVIERYINGTATKDEMVKAGLRASDAWRKRGHFSRKNCIATVILRDACALALNIDDKVSGDGHGATLFAWDMRVNVRHAAANLIHADWQNRKAREAGDAAEAAEFLVQLELFTELCLRQPSSAS
jgi:hypothetical protein